MSLAMALGRRGHVLNSVADDAATKVATVDSPVLHEGEMARLRDPSQMKGLRACTLSTLFPKDQGKSLKQAVADLCEQAVELVESGSADVLILSDMGGVSGDQLYVPPLVAVGAVHHELISRGLRMRSSLVVETGQCWSTHHLAVLVGYGASAVHPYLAFEVSSGVPKTSVSEMGSYRRKHCSIRCIVCGNIRCALLESFPLHKTITMRFLRIIPFNFYFLLSCLLFFFFSFFKTFLLRLR